MSFSRSSDLKKIKCLFVADAHCQLLVVKIVSTIWANMLRKRRDTLLGKIKNNMSFKSIMDLQNAPLSGLLELFPKEAIENAVKNSNRVLHDEAFRKAVSLEKLVKKSTNKLQFSQSAQ